MPDQSRHYGARQHRPRAPGRDGWRPVQPEYDVTSPTCAWAQLRRVRLKLRRQHLPRAPGRDSTPTARTTNPTTSPTCAWARLYKYKNNTSPTCTWARRFAGRWRYISSHIAHVRLGATPTGSAADSSTAQALVDFMKEGSRGRWHPEESFDPPVLGIRRTHSFLPQVPC